MPAQLLGAHMPTGKGLPSAVRAGAAIGCTAIQVFTNNPRQWKGRDIDDVEPGLLAEALAETGMTGQIVSHDTYLINLCAPDEEIRAKSQSSLTAELLRCAKLGIPYVVSHMGAHMKQGEDVGIKMIAESALEILKETPETVTLLMETTAGQGSSMNYRFDQIAAILDACGGHERLCVCLDTCHIFAAGYDIRTEETYNKTFEEFHRLVEIERIKTIHCNDSKKELGSRVDRHDHIGEGLIGPEAFRLLVNDPRFEQVPIVIETPDADTMHAENLKRLMSFRVQ